MVDFLKANPFCSIEDYKWKLNPRLTKIMSLDHTRIHYLTEKEKQRRKSKIIDGSNLTNDLGVPIFGGKKK